MVQSNNPSNGSIAASRRDFLKTTSAIAAATALGGIALTANAASESSPAAPAVHTGAESTIRVALIGCGGRGGGAIINAFDAGRGRADAKPAAHKPTTLPASSIKLVAMADVFDERVKGVYDSLNGNPNYKTCLDVPDDHKFVGFDGYQKAIDCLRPGDIAIMTTPPAFRWVHFKYAIDKGVNVFMEKPITVDGPTTKRMMALGELAKTKNLKVGVGLMCRHCVARAALLERIQDGMLGDIITLRAYRVHGPVADCFVPKNPGQISDTLYQIQKFHGFLWASGGLFNDFYIHNIDECCWMKGGWPVEAKAMGGRHYRGDMVDQNFDVYDVEYTFADGAKLFLQGRAMDGCAGEFASYASGSKGIAQITLGGHTPAKCRFWSSQDMTKHPIWFYPDKEPNPYQLEWDDLLEAIRNDKPYNEVQRGAMASHVSNMGRMAAHTGQIITSDQMMNCDHEFAPGADKLTNDGPAPLLVDASTGKYPVPAPGIKTTREF